MAGDHPATVSDNSDVVLAVCRGIVGVGRNRTDVDAVRDGAEHTSIRDSWRRQDLRSGCQRASNVGIRLEMVQRRMANVADIEPRFAAVHRLVNLYSGVGIEHVTGRIDGCARSCNGGEEGAIAGIKVRGDISPLALLVERTTGGPLDVLEVDRTKGGVVVGLAPAHAESVATDRLVPRSAEGTESSVVLQAHDVRFRISRVGNDGIRQDAYNALVARIGETLSSVRAGEETAITSEEDRLRSANVRESRSVEVSV